MAENNMIKISVRNLVEFVLTRGDLVSDFSGSSRNTDAIRIHQKIQKSGGNNYEAEVYLLRKFDINGINIEISGRADGIIKGGDKIVIDEIKTTGADVNLIDEDYNVLHWAQAKCYGYIYCLDNCLQSIKIQLTYCNIDTYEIKRLVKEYSIGELEEFFSDLISQYEYWALKQQNWHACRDESINKLEFPFQSFRRGQRNFAIYVYRTVRDGKKLFAQAPTGTGKTAAALFPSIKAMGEGHVSKIFYLTAKTMTGTIAEKTLHIMKGKGLKIKFITLTAKDKICFSRDSSCNPGECIYARGYYDKIKGALDDILNIDDYDRKTIEQYAEKHKVCPFEFSLDLSLWCDVIICDYNYVFDPRASLKRFFLDNKGEYCFLVDEAHNLIDRAREMYSSSIDKKKILEIKKKYEKIIPEIKKCLNKINKLFIDMRRQCEENNNFIVSDDPPNDLSILLRALLKVIEKWLIANKGSEFKDEMLDFYFDIFGFLRIYELYDERYVTYIEKEEDDVRITLFCIDPSYLICETLKKGKSAVFFSATLTPLDYFRQVLGGDENSKQIILPSPFPRNNLCLMINDSISTKYKDREKTLDKVYESINAAISGKKGNYMVFFPSYEYMMKIYEKFSLKDNIKVIVQSSGMTEKEKEDFLNEFSHYGENTMVAFAVMGGVFGEGIDLSGEKLSGAVIVGVGLPKICAKRNIIKSYFDKEKGTGFEFAYIYPGINKVLQSAGRVIRTEKDRGVVLLIDGRYSSREYRYLMPREWNSPLKVYSKERIGKIVSDFWKQK